MRHVVQPVHVNSPLMSITRTGNGYSCAKCWVSTRTGTIGARLAPDIAANSYGIVGTSAWEGTPGIYTGLVDLTNLESTIHFRVRLSQS